MSELRVVIVAEHASARFGGEAALPLHYFRVLRGREIPVWLVSHARSRAELSSIYPQDRQIVYVEDTRLHRALWTLGRWLPDAVSYITTGFVSRLATQMAQRRIVRSLIDEHAITLVHQPMPVSPREPSALFGFGIPVVIGPMNGGMDFPESFRKHRGAAERLLLTVGRASAAILNMLLPGKRRAALLLVANERTRAALPRGSSSNVAEIVENGVDLGLWNAEADAAVARPVAAVSFVFMGRLVGWKAVDLLVRAYAIARLRSDISLSVVGDGDERRSLEKLAEELGMPLAESATPGAIYFSGWLPQAECAAHLARADALVLPSLLECGGAVILEAMALGKPVIATAWGGPLDYLDASCGILVKPASPDSLVAGFAAAMVDLAASDATRHQMGIHGKEKVRRLYDWERKVDRIVEFYAEVEHRHGST